MNSQTNKSEEENDKIVTLKFNYSNAKSKSKTFGEIELKYISVGDLTFFVELLDKVKGDKEFVTNFRKAIKTYYQKRVERLQTALGPMIESSIQV